MTVDPLSLVRGVHFAATILATGTLCFIALIAGATARELKIAGIVALRRQLILSVWLVLAVAVITGAAWLVLLASDILGTSIADGCLHGGAWLVVTDTRFGLVWCIRLALALLLALLLPWPETRWLQITIAATFLALPAWVRRSVLIPRASELI